MLSSEKLLEGGLPVVNNKQWNMDFAATLTAGRS
jgi:hypothetical protein